MKILGYRFARSDETKCEIIRCSGGLSFRGKWPLAECVWFSASHEKAFNAVTGKLPIKVVELDKLRDPARPIVLLHAFVLVTQPDNRRQKGDHHSVVRVTDTRENCILNIRRITRAANYVPEFIAAGIKRWFVNSIMNFNTFNEIYVQVRELIQWIQYIVGGSGRQIVHNNNQCSL